jgi:hypothetical protein
MSEDFDNDFDCDVSYDDALALARKVNEMAERVATAHRIVPGAVATTGIEIDDVRYEMTLRVAPLGSDAS